ncbi:sodium:calcium antiporter [Planctobacterium marinum]|uniref:Cation transporter n=1 Tax=Planctobacterium marinum TaxID=1631968 RepID=A0AA48KMZ0_9ALTE|nr:cation transporter [Planctobacterium marinum]
MSPLLLSCLLFISAAFVMVFAGVKLVKQADTLADQTGMGEALFGIVFLAGITSLPDFASTLSAALDSRADLAISNIMGSMVLNLAFLGVADILYRKANLEHAAASPVNLMLAGLLIALLTLPMFAVFTPLIAGFNVHPVTPIIIVAYLFGLHLVQKTQKRPMWFPRKTHQTVTDDISPNNEQNAALLWFSFLSLALITAVAGWVLMGAAKEITHQTGLPDTLVGGVFTALVTSLPELVTTIAAIRIGALTLAVSNIFGTNCFNILVVAAADIGYTDGSIYHAMDPLQMTWGLVAILMSAILLLGMILREKYGIGRIGFESALMLGVYVIAVVLITSNV